MKDIKLSRDLLQVTADRYLLTRRDKFVPHRDQFDRIRQSAQPHAIRSVQDQIYRQETYPAAAINNLDTNPTFVIQGKHRRGEEMPWSRAHIQTDLGRHPTGYGKILIGRGDFDSKGPGCAIARMSNKGHRTG